jgi:hypothetical protein
MAKKEEMIWRERREKKGGKGDDEAKARGDVYYV